MAEEFSSLLTVNEFIVKMQNRPVYRKKYTVIIYYLMENQQKIDTIRSHINTIDSAMLKLLHKRLAYAKEIGQLKKMTDRNIEDRQREKEVLQRMLSENNGLLPEETIETIYTEIMTVCKKSQ